MNPKVAIITRTLNRPLFLERAMQSVLNQTEKDWVHIIVNDGGDKNALESTVEPFREQYGDRLQIINQANSGMQKAAISGIEQSKSEYIAIHDDDDSWDPEYLKETCAFLDDEGPKSHYQGVICQTLKILEKSKSGKLPTKISEEPYIPLQEVTLFRVGFENPFPPIAFLFRRSAYEEVGGINPKWDVVADLDFNIRFLRKFDIGVLPETLAYYHWRDSDSEAETANSITAGSSKHRKLLFELKNHYLRSAETPADLAVGLSLQLSQYLLEDEWMTAEIREKLLETFNQLQRLNEQFEEIREFQHKSAWPALQELQEAIGEIRDKSASVEPALKTLNDLWKVASESKDQLSKLDQANEALDTLSEKLSGSTKTLDGIWEKTAESTKTLHENWAKAEENRAKAEETKAEVVHLKQQVAQLEKAIGEVQKYQQESNWPKMDEIYQYLVHFKESNDSLTQDASGKIEDLNSQLENLQIQQNALEDRLRESTLISIGPFKIKWQKKIPQKPDSE